MFPVLLLLLPVVIRCPAVLIGIHYPSETISICHKLRDVMMVMVVFRIKKFYVFAVYTSPPSVPPFLSPFALKPETPLLPSWSAGTHH